MARSWRNFFRKTEEPEQETVQTAEEAEAPDSAEDVPTAEEVQARQDTPQATKVLEEEAAEEALEEAEAGEPEVLPEPDVVEEAPDEEAAAEEQEVRSGGWFGRLRTGLKRSRESMVGQLNAAIAEFRGTEDEEFWERVEAVSYTHLTLPTTPYV